jgi:hypothetical protein
VDLGIGRLSGLLPHEFPGRGDNAIKFGTGWRDVSFGFTGLRGGNATARFNDGVAAEANLYRNSNTETGQWHAFGYIQNA